MTVDSPSSARARLASICALASSFALFQACGSGDITPTPGVIDDDPGGGGAATSSVDVLLGDAPIDELFAFRATVESLRFDLDGGGATQNLLVAPTEMEFLGLQDVLGWLSSTQLAVGTYTGVRVGFSPGSYVALDTLGNSVAVDASADELAVSFASPVVLVANGYARIEVDLDLVESLDGSVGSAPISFAPEGSATVSDGSDAGALDDVRGVVSEVLGDGFRMDAFVDDDLGVPLGSIQVRVGDAAALFDVGGAAFNGASGLLASLLISSSVVEVKGSLGASGVLDAERVEIVDQGGGVGLVNQVELVGRVTSLGMGDLTLLIQQIEQGAALFDSVLGSASSAQVAFDASTNFLLAGSTPGSSADLAVGQRLKVRFDAFVGAPFSAARIEVQSAPFTGRITDVSGVAGSSQFVMRLGAGDPAISGGLVDTINTDVTVDFASADVALDSAGKPALDPARLLVGLSVQVEGEISGASSAPTLSAERVSVRAGRLRGEVILSDSGARRFTVLATELQSAFGAGEVLGNVDAFFLDSTVLEGDASLEADFFALLDGADTDEVVTVELEGLGNGMALQVDAFELEVARSEIPAPDVSVVGAPFDLGLLAVDVEADDGDMVDEGEQVTFTLTDDLAEAKYESFELFFGDGSSEIGLAATTSVTHTYAQAGVFDVTLVASGPGGETTLVLPGFVNVRINADFTPVSQVQDDADFAVSFTDASFGGTGTSFLWDFGDGSSGADTTEQNPTHTYTVADTYDVSLTVTGPTGSSSETRMELVVVDVLAGFSSTPATGEASLSVDFTDASTGGVDQWLWDFGDGSSGPENTQQNPTHVYDTEGSYNVTLLSTAPSGSSDTASVNGAVVVEINASFSSTSTGAPVDSLNFTASVVGVDPGFTATFAWNFGDPGSGGDNTSTLQNPTHTFSDDEDHLVTLVVTGLTDTDTATATVSIDPAAPTAGFTPSTQQNGDVDDTVGETSFGVSFSDDSSGIIDSYAWDFGAGSPASSTARNPGTVEFPPGKHTISLTVTGPGGMDTETKNNLVQVTSTIEIGAQKDATLYEVDAETPLSGGAASGIFVGETAQPTATLDERRALIQFDVLSALGSSPDVTAATLTLTDISPGGVDPDSLTLSRVTKDWGEGSVDPLTGAGGEGAGDTANAGDATWLAAQQGTLNWDNPGGDSTGTSATGAVSGSTLTLSSGTMQTDLESWANGGFSNFGWLLRDTDLATGEVLKLGSRENATSGNRPVLRVTFFP